MKFYVLVFSCGSPWISEAFDTVLARDTEAKLIFNGSDFFHVEDRIGYLDIDTNGNPSVGTYTNEDLLP